MKKGFIAVIVSLLAFFVSCGTLTFTHSSAPPANQPANHPADHPNKKPVPTFGNNSNVMLEAGTYNGFVINRNSVTISGTGKNQTIIAGDVVIQGNNAVLRNLTIEGNVNISGNNANLKDCVIHGVVNSSGKNNLW